jgi:hypothetical protein
VHTNVYMQANIHCLAHASVCMCAWLLFLCAGNCVRHRPHPKDESEPLYTNNMPDYHRADCDIWKNTVTTDVNAQLCSHSNPDFGSDALPGLGTRGSGAMICDYEVRADLHATLHSCGLLL